MLQVFKPLKLFSLLLLNTIFVLVRNCTEFSVGSKLIYYLFIEGKLF